MWVDQHGSRPFNYSAVWSIHEGSLHLTQYKDRLQVRMCMCEHNLYYLSVFSMSMCVHVYMHPYIKCLPCIIIIITMSRRGYVSPLLHEA